MRMQQSLLLQTLEYGKSFPAVALFVRDGSTCLYRWYDHEDATVTALTNTGIWEVLSCSSIVCEGWLHLSPATVITLANTDNTVLWVWESFPTVALFVKGWCPLVSTSAHADNCDWFNTSLWGLIDVLFVPSAPDCQHAMASEPGNPIYCIFCPPACTNTHSITNFHSSLRIWV